MLLHVNHFMFSVLYSGVVGTGGVRTAVMLVSEFSGTHCGECHVITVLCDVT